MKMKKGVLHVITVLGFLVFIVLGLACATSPNEVDLRARVNESIVVVRRTDNFSDRIRIYLNDQQVERVNRGSSVSFKVPNGEHRLEVRTPLLRSQVIIFEANSQRINFTTAITQGLQGGIWDTLGKRLELTQTDSAPLR
jgi:hypothetical protein